MIQKISSSSPVNNNSSSLSKNLSNPAFKGKAFFICNNMQRQKHFLDICRDFCACMKFKRGQDVQGNGHTKGNMGYFVAECEKKFDKDFRRIAKKFAKGNGLGFNFRRTERIINDNKSL